MIIHFNSFKKELHEPKPTCMEPKKFKVSSSEIKHKIQSIALIQHSVFSVVIKLRDRGQQNNQKTITRKRLVETFRISCSICDLLVYIMLCMENMLYLLLLSPLSVSILVSEYVIGYSKKKKKNVPQLI